MANDSLNLKYTGYSKFFTNIAKIRNEIKAVRGSANMSVFTEADAREIGRGKSYAVFPELIKDVDEGRTITIESFKTALTDRGITNTEFQNKILYLVLQNRAGIHYPLGNIVNSLLLENGHQLLMNRNYNVALKVNSSNEITLVFKGVWEDFTQDPRVPAIEADVEVKITPEKAEIINFHLTKIADTEQANNGFQFLQENHQNILSKLITYLRDMLGFDTGRTLESKEDYVEESHPAP
ncbi:hypothetical protein [Legionella shakespearei]|uniref:Uncharacterized protein n=2 Tax=Legionella shakespearei TaxID=45075 RepID=A0A0W0Z1P5_9GAMM|nr:hypothetical protein [Legionella shakespearei]KTD62830.1 hypothetical protein Lsha_0862 [Legionella shakespearei DSM 23087]